MLTRHTLELTVELHENERRWVGTGFGKGGLLPTDPGPFSTTDGSLSWKSMEEANEDLRLLGRGWIYKEEEAFSTTQTDDSEECWMYANDFKVESLSGATPEQGLLQWVRFRRLSRTKIFLPIEFVSEEIYEKCDHCDSSATESLSKWLLDVLSYCSLLHNMKKVQDSGLLLLKERLIEIAFSHQVSKEGSVDAFCELDNLQKKLESFVKKELRDTTMSRLISSIDFSFSQRTDRIEFKQRRTEVATRFLPKDERDFVAALIVRKLDPHFQVHCNEICCGEECRFAPVQCLNEGCSVTLPKVYMDAHDEACPYKSIECVCGDTTVKHELPKHQREVCKLRNVACDFANIGCFKVAKACNMNQHVVEDVNSHLLLAVNRMMEYEEQFRNMRGRITVLEHDNKELKQSLEYQQASIKEIGKVDTKIHTTSKALAALEATSKYEFKKVKEDIEKRQKASIKEIGNVNTKVNKTSETLAALELTSTNEFKKISEDRKNRK